MLFRSIHSKKYYRFPKINPFQYSCRNTKQFYYSLHYRTKLLALFYIKYCRKAFFFFDEIIICRLIVVKKDSTKLVQFWLKKYLYDIFFDNTKYICFHFLYGILFDINSIILDQGRCRKKVFSHMTRGIHIISSFLKLFIKFKFNYYVFQATISFFKQVKFF